jgi:hypothetical protein
LCGFELNAVLIVYPDGFQTFFVAMQLLVMQRIDCEQFFYVIGIFERFDTRLILFRDGRLKTVFFIRCHPRFVQFPQIRFIKFYFHLRFLNDNKGSAFFEILQKSRNILV